MADLNKGIILVGHGGIPKGFPADEVSKLKRLEAQRRAAGQPMSAEELELDTKIRTWPRTPETDPYQAGLQALGTQMKPLVNGAYSRSRKSRWSSRLLYNILANMIVIGI